MKKIEYIVIGVSLVITALLSTFFGLAGRTICGTFWSWFWITYIAQIIIFLIWNSFLIQKDFAQLENAEIQTLEKLSKFVIRLTCAYCKQNNNVPIQLNIKNIFKCDSCNQVNSVQMQFTATTMSTPIESVKIPLPDSEHIEFKVIK